jgi:hypothetical protein
MALPPEPDRNSARNAYLSSFGGLWTILVARGGGFSPKVFRARPPTLFFLRSVATRNPSLDRLWIDGTINMIPVPSRRSSGGKMAGIQFLLAQAGEDMRQPRKSIADNNLSFFVTDEDVVGNSYEKRA